MSLRARIAHGHAVDHTERALRCSRDRWWSSCRSARAKALDGGWTKVAVGALDDHLARACSGGASRHASSPAKPRCASAAEVPTARSSCPAPALEASGTAITSMRHIARSRPRGRPCPRARSNESRRRGYPCPTARSTDVLRRFPPFVRTFRSPFRASRGPQFPAYPSAPGTPRTCKNLAQRMPRPAPRYIPRQGDAAHKVPSIEGSPPPRVRLAGGHARCRSRPRSCCPRRGRGSPGWRRTAAGRRCPASSSGSSIRARSTGWPHGCRRVRRSSRPRTARRRPPRWPREILAPAVRLAHNRCGREPRLGGRLRAPRGPRGRARAVRGRRGRASRGGAAAAAARGCLGNLFRDQLDRYGELELVAERWRARVAALRRDAALVVNGDDPQVGEPRVRARARRSSSGSTIRARPRRSSSTRPTRSSASAAARRTSSRRPTWDIWATTAAPLRPRAAAARRRSPATIELDGLESASFDLVTPAGDAPRRLAFPGLYNVYNALAAAALAPRARDRAGRDRGGPGAVRRRLRPLRADRAGRPRPAHAPDQEPRRARTRSCGRSSPAGAHACC